MRSPWPQVLLVLTLLVSFLPSAQAAYLEAPTLPSYAAGSGLTIEAWVKVVAEPGYDPRIIRAVNATEGPCGNVSTQVWELWICSQSICPTGKVFASFQKNGTCVEAHSNVCVADGNWHHVAAAYNGSILQVYVDGQPSGSSVAASGMDVDVSGGHVTVGDATAHDNALDGWIDEVRVWSIARTSTEINNDKAVELPPTAGLVGYWKLNGDPNDASGNGNPLNPTVTGISYGVGQISSAVRIANGGGLVGCTTQCSDGIDNDGDGLVDFPADPGCASPSDNTEFNFVPQPRVPAFGPYGRAASGLLLFGAGIAFLVWRRRIAHAA